MKEKRERNIKERESKCAKAFDKDIEFRYTLMDSILKFQNRIGLND